MRQTPPQPLLQHASVVQPCGTTAGHNEWITKHDFFTCIVSLVSGDIHANGDTHFSKFALYHVKKTPFDWEALVPIERLSLELIFGPSIVKGPETVEGHSFLLPVTWREHLVFSELDSGWRCLPSVKLLGLGNSLS